MKALAISSHRRRVLGGMLAAWSAAWVPTAAAQQQTARQHAAFVALSAILTGRSSLDDAHAARLFDALAANDPNFAAAVTTLLAMIDKRRINPRRLQSLLDAEHSALAPLPRSVMSAWYLGIVGEGARARCIAFESALNAAVVADVLMPPSYCHGAYGSWSGKPSPRPAGTPQAR
jgi:hypothetical protein